MRARKFSLTLTRTLPLREVEIECEIEQINRVTKDVYR